MKRTKQGVPDLNTRGINGRRRPSIDSCNHRFVPSEPEEVMVYDPDSGGMTKTQVQIEACIWCKQPRRAR